jgi:hypothetical protein
MSYKCYIYEEGMELRPGALVVADSPHQRAFRVYLPNGNWESIFSNTRQCEIVGDFPNITRVKRDRDPNHECSIANYKNGERFHGFLWHGDLIDIDQVARSRTEWNSLSRADQLEMLEKVGPPGYIKWPLSDE